MILNMKVDKVLMLFAVILTQCQGFWFTSWMSGDLVSYRLYTRQSNSGERFKRSKATVQSSSFNPELPTKIFLHGWFGAGWNWYITELRVEMLKQVDCNFIEADWSQGSVNPNYKAAKLSAQQAGEDVASLLTWLNTTFGLKYEDVHVIGHSLGAQAAGSVGKHIVYPQIGRISGLDPAQPGFNLSDPEDTLGPEDASFVDVIHTTRVATTPMGHADFYPNGGKLGIPIVTWFHSHMQAVYIYTASINSECQFEAYKCVSYQKLMAGRCSKQCPSVGSCNKMGYHASPDGARGSLQLSITEVYPYC